MVETDCPVCGGEPVEAGEEIVTNTELPPVPKPEALHYGDGVPQRKVPRVLKSLTGLSVTQGALAQVAIRIGAGGPITQRYSQLHRNEEVREVIGAHYQGTLCTDRGKSYDAKELNDVDQQK